LSLRVKSDLTLLLVAAIWGTGFVAQRLAVGQLGTFYYNGGRFLLAGLASFLFARLQRFWPRRAAGRAGIAGRKSLPWMLLAGTLLFAAAGLQQAGLATTSIGNASFITGLYVVLIPLILMIAFGQRVAWLSWAAVGMAVLGVMLLSLQGDLRLSPGDLLELAGALMWALHVILVGWLAGQGVDALVFSVVQLATCGALNLALALGLDPGGAGSLAAAWPVVLYSALIPIGLGFTLQVAGQRSAPTVDAAIILSMEAVFATLFGALILREMLAPRQMAGCGLIFAAMILAQVRRGAVIREEREVRSEEEERRLGA
jgi:drug/metabolite transporter (DMT)-like permease